MRSEPHPEDYEEDFNLLQKRCLRRFEELKTDYPEHEDFFNANKNELLYAMQDVRSEEELQEIRTEVETSGPSSRFPYSYSSSSVYAVEDALITIIDLQRSLLAYSAVLRFRQDW